jgi:hypothetical protein
MLYDEAIKYVSKLGCGLLPHGEATDRGLDEWGTTSEDAGRIWDYYRNNRPDVTETPNGFMMK